MTTLKTYHADEIASALDAQLKDASFVGLYKKADMDIGSPAITRFMTELPKKTNVGEATKLWNETAPDFKTEPDEGAQAKALWAQKFPGTQPPAAQKAEDGGCAQHAETQDGCPECADATGLAIAIDFATRHVVKIADALDKAGFAGVAEAFDETLRKLAAQRPIVVLAEKKKTRGRSYGEWSKFFGKKGPEVGEKFRKTYKGALEHAKEKGMGADKAEEYAMRTALDKMPKSYFKEPGKEHGPGKSGPLTAKRSK